MWQHSKHTWQDVLQAIHFLPCVYHGGWLSRGPSVCKVQWVPFFVFMIYILLIFTLFTTCLPPVTFHSPIHTDPRWMGVRPEENGDRPRLLFLGTWTDLDNNRADLLNNCMDLILFIQIIQTVQRQTRLSQLAKTTNARYAATQSMPRGHWLFKRQWFACDIKICSFWVAACAL